MAFKIGDFEIGRKDSSNSDKGKKSDRTDIYKETMAKESIQNLADEAGDAVKSGDFGFAAELLQQAADVAKKAGLSSEETRYKQLALTAEKKARETSSRGEERKTNPDYAPRKPLPEKPGKVSEIRIDPRLNPSRRRRS
jgi:hypothetical protein